MIITRGPVIWRRRGHLLRVTVRNGWQTSSMEVNYRTKVPKTEGRENHQERLSESSYVCLNSLT